MCEPMKDASKDASVETLRMFRTALDTFPIAHGLLLEAVDLAAGFPGPYKRSYMTARQRQRDFAIVLSMLTACTDQLSPMQRGAPLARSTIEELPHWLEISQKCECQLQAIAKILEKKTGKAP